MAIIALENVMPLWKIYHPVGAFTVEDRRAFAARITELYGRLPKFYVNVIFQEIPRDSFYIGGEPVDNFIRLSIEHIARTLPNDRKVWWLERTNEVIAPFVKDRGFEWEFHIDETPFDLWSVQGYQPPPANSEDEKRWIRENKASPRTDISSLVCPAAKALSTLHKRRQPGLLGSVAGHRHDQG